MQRADDPQAAALAAEVRAFVTQNFDATNHPSAVGSAQPWFLALRRHAWYVPHWPVAFGGLNWSPLQTYVFQRELLRAGAPLPPGATTHLIASWLFRWLPEQPAPAQTQGRRWLAGIAGDVETEPQRWRVGVDLRRPDWPRQALADKLADKSLDAGAHWVLQPYLQGEHPDGTETSDTGGEQATTQARWAIRVLRGAHLPAQKPKEAEKLNAAPSQEAITNVELGVEQRWAPILSGLALDEVEALLKPVQLAWQGSEAPFGTSGTSGVPASEADPSSLVPSIGLGWRLERVRQVLAADSRLQTELETLQLSQIALASLQVMEARAVQVETSTEPQTEPQAEEGGLAGANLAAAVAQAAERLGWRIAQPETDTLGYFALPLFDETLQHNEGPVTPALYDPLVKS